MSFVELSSFNRYQVNCEYIIVEGKHKHKFFNVLIGVHTERENILNRIWWWIKIDQLFNMTLNIDMPNAFQKKIVQKVGSTLPSTDSYPSHRLVPDFDI